jgi:hypothetical protein
LDDCIAERLELSVRQHANHKTRELAGQGGFERRKDVCSLCGETKLVIRRDAHRGMRSSRAERVPCRGKEGRRDAAP